MTSFMAGVLVGVGICAVIGIVIAVLNVASSVNFDFDFDLNSGGKW